MTFDLYFDVGGCPWKIWECLGNISSMHNLPTPMRHAYAIHLKAVAS